MDLQPMSIGALNQGFGDVYWCRDGDGHQVLAIG